MGERLIFLLEEFQIIYTLQGIELNSPLECGLPISRKGGETHNFTGEKIGKHCLGQGLKVIQSC